jgi:hypothetical protein
MDPIILEHWRVAVVALDQYACGYDKGRAKTDAVYQEVVEGRDVPSVYTHYSSCGDRAHWRAFRIGIRQPWVNRKAYKGWRSGLNISTLAYSCPFSRAPNANWVPEAGDEMLIWNSSQGTDAHSLSIVLPGNGVATTANYGAAGMSAAAFPGAKISTSPLVCKNGVWTYGARRVQRVLKLADLVGAITEKPDFKGPDFTDVWTGEVQDAIEQSLVQI